MIHVKSANATNFWRHYRFSQASLLID